MGFMEIMKMANYNFDSNGVMLYDIYETFIDTNYEIMTYEQLKKAEENLLSPKDFDDGRKRSEVKYNKVQLKITKAMTNLENTRGYVA